MTTTTTQHVFIVDGDLLKSDCTIIAHQANCFKTMGAGIAKQIKLKYPEAYEADKSFPMPAKQRLGHCSRTFNSDKTRIIVNLYGQYNYGRVKDHVYTDYQALGLSLARMFEGLDKLERANPDFFIKIGLPYGIGAGSGGGDWARIEAGITRLAKKYNREVYLYKL